MVGPRSPMGGEGQTPHADRAYSGEFCWGKGRKWEKKWERGEREYRVASWEEKEGESKRATEREREKRKR